MGGGGGEPGGGGSDSFYRDSTKIFRPFPHRRQCLVLNQNERHQNCTLTAGLVTLLNAKKEEYNAWF